MWRKEKARTTMAQNNTGHAGRVRAHLIELVRDERVEVTGGQWLCGRDKRLIVVVLHELNGLGHHLLGNRTRCILDGLANPVVSGVVISVVVSTIVGSLAHLLHCAGLLGDLTRHLEAAALF
jgi:hypothetical protein